MHLCFLDESGTPPPNDKGLKYFVIAGLFVPEARWHDIATKFQELKNRHRVRGEIKWRYFGPANDDPKNSVQHMDQEERDIFRASLYGILTGFRSVKVVACVAS